ncbi:histone-lysine N-methyltransferase ASH1L-like isoform X2 [Melanotaenia boesemani]|uniref:histone-lysine N-methyltransferase ASH1L-like isoform X2 n=1 Tax=Melanotaenia boesemani TaxID=1250792 RepID=UPI001C0545ED|nr:histone-lysine N-methyltransferase ASH1L-like isoform X2 [Melanotaenia boesemani]XP_041844748.1 histone-lysine N-methyltransferase ASH1L-like isoform X2 [Melanotaenia boesemani]
MEQRVKGGTPPTTTSTLDPASAPENSEPDQVPEKKRRGEVENGSVGKKEEEKRGAGKKREGDKGTVLELLIEGRCGSIGQQELPISGREASCPEGNVRVRIGLEAKRTKKPPKILESYVCKPTIRTYQRQGRGGLLRADGEGQQSKSSSTTDEANREQRSDLDAVQTTSKKTASAASPPLTSSLSSSSAQSLSLSSTFTTDSTPASVPAVTSQGTKTVKQVPVKLADKAEENSNSSSEKVKKDKVLSVNGQPVPAGPKSCSPTADPTASTTPSTPCMQTVSALETRNDGKSSKKHNGLVQTAKQKGLSNGRSSANIIGTSSSSKNKVGKQSSISSVSSMNSSTRLPGSSSSADSPSYHPVTPKQQSSSTVDLSPAQLQGQDPSLQPLPEKKKEKKAKKEKRRDKKSKRDRLDADRTKSESRNEEVKKKKKEKGKDGKPRHSKEKDDKHRCDDSRRDELQSEKRKEKLSPDRQKAEDNNTKCSETAGNVKLDKTCKAVNPSRLDEKEKTNDSCKPAKQAEPATTGDTSKSKEQDISRHPTVPPTHSISSAPPPLPMPSAHAPISPPSSPPEQDSRPLKKRKARRPSWTKLVHRAQRLENQESPSDSLHNSFQSFPQITKTLLPAKAPIQQTDESDPAQSSSLFSSSSPLSSGVKPPTPKQDQLTSDSSPSASRVPVNTIRKRGRPKSHSSSIDEPPPRLSPTDIPTEVPHLGCDRVQTAPVLEPSPVLQCAAQSKSSPKKRGRPPKRHFLEDQSGDALNRTDHMERSKDFSPPEKGNRQLKIRRLINEMKKRKKRRLHKAILSGYVGKEGKGGEAADGKTSLRMCKSIEATTVHTLSALSSSFGSKLGPQINVSKRGTIYMGKRRGRKPKSQTAYLNSRSQNSTQLSLFTTSSETSLFASNQPQHPPSHPFPSPSLTHSSGAQSPYSEGSLTEPTPSLLFSHPFSLPSPSSSCTSPRPPSSSSLSPFVKKSCPCQGRHHFPFHQSSCKLSCATPPVHHTPGSPGHLKEATPSPRSESHSDETLPSDSGIGTDNNSVSERGEMRGARGMLRLGQGSGVILGGQRLSSSLVDRPSPVSSPLAHMPRHTNPLSSSNIGERHRDRHRHRQRDYDCSSSYTCLCPCPCPGHNKCTHTDYYPCVGHTALKRQKNKHKKKHQQLLMQDPEFLAELDDLIAQFNEIHIGRRSWARVGLGQGFDGSAAGGRRHHSSSHSLRSNIFRINLNGFYSPHPSSFSANHSFTPQSYYPCHCNRKPESRQCGCPSKFQETIENVGFYSSYHPVPPTLYHHLPASYPLPPPHQYAPHQPHHAHFFLNPARFHRRRSRLLREGALGGEVEGDLGGGSRGGGSGFTSSLSCGCGRNEHKHKHKHRHRHCERDVDDKEELHEDEEEPEMLAGSKGRSGFILGQGEGRRKAARGSGNMLSKESPWLRQNGNIPFSTTASSSSSSSAERYKHTSLTSLGLGSSHLSSFGGGWGGLGQSLTKFGNLGSPAFGNSNPSWRGFTGDQLAGRLTVSDEDDEDDEDAHESHLYETSTPPSHTNLFTFAAMATGGRGLRSGLFGRNPGSGEGSWRRDEPAWTERREAGLQGDSRSRGQQKSVPTSDNVAVKNKRGPGRPRKHPLPSPSPNRSSATPSMSSADLLSARSHNRDGREVGGKREETVAERGGGNMIQQVTELELQAKRKRGRKRKHGDSSCHQSLNMDKTECDNPPECQSDVDQASFQSLTIQREERADGPPWKKFLKAGLYSDDYKTTDPPSHSQKNCSESMEYTPGEHEYSLLPAPIHVGKYLRLKRIHFQLPYDVMWLWQHNQLYRQPAVPLKRKRRYCRMKERTASSLQTVEESSSDITSLFPHLDMEPLTSSERSFVVKHHVFLVRNWELVRDRQIQMRIERERERDEDREEGEEGEEGDSQSLSCDGANGDDSHIKSGP